MPRATDNRPLVDRLQKRILKKQGGSSDPQPSLGDRFLTDSDSTLHLQSVKAIKERVGALVMVTDCLTKALTGGEVSATRHTTTGGEVRP